MKATYYKDTMRSHMILPCPQVAETEGYQYRMLEMNRIGGILPCGLRHIDGERYLYYDITGKQSIYGLYEGRKMTGTEFFRLLRDMDSVSGSLAEYLLDEQHLVLSPEQIFYDFSSGKYSFTYYPGALTEPDLFRFLAEIVEPTDKRAAAAAYHLCSAADSDRQSLREAVREEAAQEDRPMPWENEELHDFEKADPEKTDIDITDFERKEKEHSQKRVTEISPSRQGKKRAGRNKSWLKVLLILFLLGGAGGLFAVPFLLYVSQRESRLCVAGAILLLAAAGLLIAELIVKKYKERKSGREDQGRQSVYAVSNEKDLPLVGTVSKGDYRLVGDETNTIRFSEQETIGRLYGRDRGNRIDLRTLPVTVGKAQAYADVILSDPSVSRVHARIYKGEEGDIEIRDLGSTNGTWINGVRLGPNEKFRVHRGDEIRFGNIEYEYR